MTALPAPAPVRQTWSYRAFARQIAEGTLTVGEAMEELAAGLFPRDVLDLLARFVEDQQMIAATVVAVRKEMEVEAKIAALAAEAQAAEEARIAANVAAFHAFHAR